MHFHLVDWIIVIVYLAGTMAAGLYGKKYVSGLSDFLVAGRQLGTFIGVATLAATEIGTITFMYYAELGYKTGFASFVNGLIAGAVMIFIGQTGFIIRRLRALGLMTIPEFFQVKYSKNLRVLTGILVATGGILNMGVFLKVEGTFLAIITGIPLSHLKATMTVILLLELVYTVLGGMVSIVITDFLQFIALSLGTILITVYSIQVTGWGHMRDTVYATMGSQGFNPFTNAQYGWAYIIFQILLWMAVDTCWQTTAMRTFSARDPETSRKVFSWTGFIYLGRGMMPMLWGIAALAMLGPKVNSLEAMPLMLTRILPVGILGLVVSGMLAATMSVNSSYLLGWSSIIAQDIILPLRKTPLSAREPGVAEPRRQFVCKPVCAFLGNLVHAAGSHLLLPQHHGVDLSGWSVRRGRRWAILETRQYPGRLLRHDHRSRRRRGLLLLPRPRQLCRAGLLHSGGIGHGRGVAAGGRGQTPPSLLMLTCDLLT